MEVSGRIPASVLQLLIPQPRPPSTSVDRKQEQNKKGASAALLQEDDQLQIIKKHDLQILKEVGQGFYGSVYLGKWKGSPVAAKLINSHNVLAKKIKLKEVMESFWDEARILARLNHPNIIGFYGVIMDGPEILLATVSEYMIDGALSDVLMASSSLGRVLDWWTRIRIARDVALGMEYLHANNVVHFDIKSDNIFVNLRDAQHPVSKIGDFGLSGPLNSKKLVCTGGHGRGTLQWMAPELLTGRPLFATEKLDVYSFGILMWEMLTGELPYKNVDRDLIKRGVAMGELRPQVPSWCDPQWRSIMEECWSQEPTERPSFTEIVCDLQYLLARYSFRPQQVIGRQRVIRPRELVKPTQQVEVGLPPLPASAIDEINRRIAALPLGRDVLGYQGCPPPYQLFPQI
ncbi:hypothetical protein H6P81_013529 [Aristolochia fimbriata]|uniref:Protein kinase domain-containing protein n=1 Tax=Aristolochia fimbriata TaxID=158543 RepID=A0AAV7EHU0_ARIFI|nr:hypothetical protein H6P81_013529 [Aristolochia fimbriata]